MQQKQKPYQDRNRHNYYCRIVIGISLSASSFIAVMLSTTAASAAFNQLGCPTASFGPPIPTSIGGKEFVRKSTIPAGGSLDMTLYNNNIHPKYWSFYTNGNVVELNPWYGHFDLETTFDSLNVWEVGAYFGGNYSYTGMLNSGTSPVQTSDIWNTNANYFGTYGRLDMSFVTDSVISWDIPPEFSQVSPRCRESSPNVASNGNTIETNSRIDGLLLGTGDTIYFTVPLSSDQVVVAMESLSAGAGADFDLYGSLSNSAPDDFSWDYRGYRTGTNEAIQVNGHSGSNLYIGVHSFNGSGHFILQVFQGTAFFASVCNVNFTPNATQRTKIKDMLKYGSAALLMYTNGHMFRHRYILHDNWTTTCDTEHGCDVCIINDTSGISRGYGYTGLHACGMVEMHGGNWAAGAGAAWLFAHESGHACYNIGDQYQGDPQGDETPRYCGHTTMANSSKARAFCSNKHCFDGQVDDIATCMSKAPHSDWYMIRNRGWSFYGPDLDWYGFTAQSTPADINPAVADLVVFQ